MITGIVFTIITVFSLALMIWFIYWTINLSCWFFFLCDLFIFQWY